MVYEERYTCKFHKQCRFQRLRSSLYTSTTALSTHLEDKHQITKDTNPTSVAAGKPTTMKQWASTSKETPPFEEALIDWIVATDQAFVAVESDYFKTLMRSGGYDGKIPGADTVANRIQDRVSASEAETTALLASTASTVSLTIDGWTSNNDKSMIGMNLTWLGPDMQQHRACIDFTQIDGKHSGENLAILVFKALKKHNVLQKLLTVTADNADNNDTCVRHLHRMMAQRYDDHLCEDPIREGSMRFKGEESQIRCFAHILHLIVEDFLDALGSSTHKNAEETLNRAAAGKHKEITAPLGYGSIAILRLIVLWTHRSPQRKLEWKKRPNVKKMIPNDVDNRWNYTLHMVDDAEAHKAALDDLVNENPVLKRLRLTKDHWRQLSDIKKVLEPFKKYTEQVSKKLPSIHLTIRMYFELDDILTKMI
jgi:hypothetical protein